VQNRGEFIKGLEYHGPYDCDFCEGLCYEKKLYVKHEYAL